MHNKTDETFSIILLILRNGLKTDIKIKWEGYDDTGQSPVHVNVPVQTEKTLMGYGKPLDEPMKTVPDKPEKKLRQAPCDAMVNLLCV